MNQIVIDASVVLKWYLVDEEYGQKTMELLDRYVSDRISITAPSLLEYEVINGLIVAKRRGRVDDKDVSDAVSGFINLGIELKSIHLYYPKVLNYCNVYNLSVYDASYLALAEDDGLPFVTADKRLFDSVKKK